MNRREQLLDLLVARTSATRERLELESTENLEKILDNSLLNEIHAEAMNSPEVVERQRRIAEINEESHRQYEEFQLSLIFRTPVLGKVAIDNFAARKIIRSWVDEAKGDTGISVQWFLKLLKDTPSLARSLQWQSADLLDPRKQKDIAEAQAEQDRYTFNQFARENGFSLVDANHQLAKSLLGSGFNSYQLSEAVSSNALSLAQASPEELERFRQEAIQAHNQRLKSMDIPALRKLAREAGARGPVAPQPDETQRIRAATETFYGTAYPPLPDEFRDGNGPEQVLNAAFIKKCSKETLRLLIKRYGSDQVTEALRTRTDGIYQY